MNSLLQTLTIIILTQFWGACIFPNGSSKKDPPFVQDCSTNPTAEGCLICEDPRFPIADTASGACRKLTVADCVDPQKPILDETVKECRALLPTDCDGVNYDPIFDESTGQCRPRTGDDCSGDTPVLDSENGSCRERLPADCQDAELPILDTTTKTCRQRISADCRDPKKPVLDQDSFQCRARKAADCSDSDKPVLDAATLLCRARIATDCTDLSKPVLDIDTLQCRARIASDCAGSSLPIFDEETKLCRELEGKDCRNEDKVFNPLNKKCVAKLSASCQYRFRNSMISCEQQTFTNQDLFAEFHKACEKEADRNSDYAEITLKDSNCPYQGRKFGCESNDGSIYWTYGQGNGLPCDRGSLLDEDGEVI